MIPGGGNPFGGQNDSGMEGRFGAAGSGAPQQPNEFTLGTPGGAEAEPDEVVHPIESRATDTLDAGLGFFHSLNNSDKKNEAEKDATQD